MRTAPAAGFTLIEVLVALAIAGLISLFALHGIGLAAQGLDRLSRHAERLDRQRSLELLLRRALATASVLPAVAGEPGFVGKPTRLSFVSIVADGGAGLYRVTLAFDPDRPAAALTMTRRIASRHVARPGEESVLMPRLHRFEIGYFGAAAPTEEARWHRQWDGIAQLPQLVRLTVEPEAAGGAAPIVIRLPHAD